MPAVSVVVGWWQGELLVLGEVISEIEREEASYFRHQAIPRLSPPNHELWMLLSSLLLSSVSLAFGYNKTGFLAIHSFDLLLKINKIFI